MSPIARPASIMRAHCWHTYKLLYPRTPQSSSAELLPSQPFPAFNCPDTGFYVCLCWISQGSSHSVPPAYQSPSRWKLCPPAHQLFPAPNSTFSAACKRALSVPYPRSLTNNSTDLNSRRLERHPRLPLPLCCSTQHLSMKSKTSMSKQGGIQVSRRTRFLEITICLISC